MRFETPRRDKLHWYLGRTTIMTAFASIIVGCIWKEIHFMITLSILFIQMVLIWLYVEKTWNRDDVIINIHNYTRVPLPTQMFYEEL